MSLAKTTPMGMFENAPTGATYIVVYKVFLNLG